MRKGSHVFVKLPNETFRGRVVDIQHNWARVAGRGSNEKTVFDEWFCVDSAKVKVVPAPSTGG